MSFDFDNWSAGRPVPPRVLSQDSRRFGFADCKHSYISSDTVTQISAVGYFDDVWETLAVADRIYVVSGEPLISILQVVSIVFESGGPDPVVRTQVLDDEAGSSQGEFGVSLNAYGAAGDRKAVRTAVTASGTALSITNGSLTSQDVGKLVFLPNAGTARTFNDRGTLKYDAETSPFTASQTLTGGTSGATANIVHVVDNGTTGGLRLDTVVGTFQDGETITDGAGGSATADGVLQVVPARTLTHWTTISEVTDSDNAVLASAVTTAVGYTAWASGTDYVKGDFRIDPNESLVWLCSWPHTSSSVWQTDKELYWEPFETLRYGTNDATAFANWIEDSNPSKFAPASDQDGYMIGALDSGDLKTKRFTIEDRLHLFGVNPEKSLFDFGGDADELSNTIWHMFSMNGDLDVENVGFVNYENMFVWSHDANMFGTNSYEKGFWPTDWGSPLGDVPGEAKTINYIRLRNCIFRNGRRAIIGDNESGDGTDTDYGWKKLEVTNSRFDGHFSPIFGGVNQLQDVNITENSFRNTDATYLLYSTSGAIVLQPGGPGIKLGAVGGVNTAVVRQLNGAKKNWRVTNNSFENTTDRRPVITSNTSTPEVVHVEGLGGDQVDLSGNFFGRSFMDYDTLGIYEEFNCHSFNMRCRFMTITNNNARDGGEREAWFLAKPSDREIPQDEVNNYGWGIICSNNTLFHSGEIAQKGRAIEIMSSQVVIDQNIIEGFPGDGLLNNEVVAAFSTSDSQRTQFWVTNNQFIKCQARELIGVKASGVDTRIDSNSFNQCNGEGINGEWRCIVLSDEFAPASGLHQFSVSGNTWEDCGTDQQNNTAIYLNGIHQGGTIANNRAYFRPDALITQFERFIRYFKIHDSPVRLRIFDNDVPAGNYIDESGDRSLFQDMEAWGNRGFLRNDTAWKPTSIASGTTQSLNVSVTDARFGDGVIAHPDIDLQDLSHSAYVRADNSVRLNLHNVTAGAIDLTPTNWATATGYSIGNFVNIADALQAYAEVRFENNQREGERLILGATQTFVEFTALASDPTAAGTRADPVLVNIKGSLDLTLDELVIVLNDGSAPAAIQAATYSKVSTHSLAALHDAAGEAGNDFVLWFDRPHDSRVNNYTRLRGGAAANTWHKCEVNHTSDATDVQNDINTTQGDTPKWLAVRWRVEVQKRPIQTRYIY